MDFLGTDYKFKIDGGAYKTELGGFISIILLIGTCFLSWIFGKDLYERKNPKFVSTESSELFAPYLGNMNFTNNLIAVRLFDENGSEIDDPSYVEFLFRYEEYIFNSSTKEIDVYQDEENMKKCSVENKNMLNSTLQLRPDLSKFYCPKMNYSLGGANMRKELNKTMVYVKFCDNGTETRLGIKCKSKDQFMEEYGLSKLYFEIYAERNIIDPTNFTYSHKKDFYYQKLGVDINDPKALYVWIYLNKAIVRTDSAMIFEEVNEEEFIEFNYVSTALQPKNSDYNSNYFFKLLSYSTTKLMIYDRSYVKIPDIMGNVGGFLSCVMFVVQFLYSIYWQNEFTAYLYSRLFSLQIDDSFDKESLKIELKSNDVASNESSVKRLKNLNESSFKHKLKKSRIDIVSVKDKHVNKDINKILSFRSKMRKEVNINGFERLSYTCLPCYNKSLIKGEKRLRWELILAADKVIEVKSEIFEVWKTIDRFRLLEKLMLNETQCFMIQNRGLQLITNEYLIESEDLENLESLKENKKKQKLFEYLKENEANQNPIDSVLLKYLSPPIKREYDDYKKSREKKHPVT